MNLAPRSTAMSMLVVDRMPPSISWRPRTSTGLVDHRQRGRCGDRLRDRYVVPIRRAEHDPLAGVEIGRRQIELGLQEAEVVAPIALVEDLADVLLDPRSRVDPGRQALGQAGDDIHHGYLAPPPGEAAREAGKPQRHEEGARGEVRVVGPQQRAEIDVVEGRRDLLVDDPRHLLRGHPGGEEAGDERARARADVDVEVVDRPVDAQEVERAQRADLVDPSREAAAAQDERGPRTAIAPLLLLARGSLRGRRPLGRRLEFDNVAHRACFIPGKRAVPKASGPGVRFVVGLVERHIRP